MKRTLLLALLMILAITGEAAGYARIAADAVSTRGQIHFYGFVSTDQPSFTFYERINGVEKKIADVEVATTYFDQGYDGILSYEVLVNAAQWRCDRLDRTFVLIGHHADGSEGERSEFSVHTPSCRHRLILKAPRRVDPGENLTATVRDTFGTGDTQGRVCLLGRCETVKLAAGVKNALVSLLVRDRTGVRPLRLTGPGQRIEQSIAVGVKAPDSVAAGPAILTTGDSLMQSVDALLTDRLEQDANVVSDIKIGSSLLRSTVVDYPTLARQQVRKYAPAATAIFLGANDFYPTTTLDGVEIECCDEPWIAEYERRARELMRIYTQNGTAAVAWLAVPAMRDERRKPAQIAVNIALRRAAAKVPGTVIVATDELLTPGNVFRPTAEVGGREVPIREDDGIHLTPAGARLVLRAVLDVFADAGVL